MLRLTNFIYAFTCNLQEFEQDRSRHFVGFQPHFNVNVTSQMQSSKIMKKFRSLNNVI